MNRPALSVTLITLNEEKNIQRAIASARWAEEVLVIDSGSTDHTVEIARNMGARVLHREWDGYGQQKNFAQDQAAHDWVLNIDADEEIPAELRAEIEKALSSGRDAKGYYLPRKTQYLGRWILHGGWYPNHLVRLADRRHARWSEPSIHEELKVTGPTATLGHPLHHFTFDGIKDQVLTNIEYAGRGAQDLLRKGRRASRLMLIAKPIGKFLETYVLKRGFLDGLPGLIISVNAAHSMFLKYAFLIEPRLQGSELADARPRH